MSMYFKLAWRNLFRNKRRTLIAGIAIGVGLASLIMTNALTLGMKDNMIATATSSFLGEGQIHRQKYRETGDVDLTINDLDTVTARLTDDPRIKRYTLRVWSYGMIASPVNVSGISVVGIDPATERYLSQVDDAITDGEYFSGDNRRDIVIGSKLAEIMEVKIGDRVVLTTAQAHSGDLAQEMFRISGIYHFNVEEMDRGMAFVRLGVAQEILGLEGQVHEIVLKFTQSDIGMDEKHPFWSEYSEDGNEAVAWTVLLPQIKVAFEMSDLSTLIVGIILFAVVSLGIINTLFMSLYERMFEFGVLRAVGTRPGGMAVLILYEAGALAIISIIIGGIIGFVGTYILSQVGIDYTGIEFVGVTFRKLLYPVLTPSQFIVFPFWVFLFTVVVGLYPAWYAARMTPADAMRKSM